jgi:hypothetical protein
MKKKILWMFGLTVLLIGVPSAVMADSLLLGPHDFHPVEEDTVYLRNELHLYLMPSSTSYGFFAPVHLPQNAKITSVVIFYYDGADPEDIHIYLEKINKYNKSGTTMADWNTLGQTFSDQIHKIFPIIGGNSIDNGGYTYYVKVSFSHSSGGANLKLYAVKIIYTTT